jgi:predicted amidohydrolase YtcJ
VAVRTGIPPHVHAIGDKGNRIILDIYEKMLTKHNLVNRDHRWRVIHAQVVHPDDVARFGRLKLVAEINPYHVRRYAMDGGAHRRGSVRAGRMPSAS